MLYLFGGLNWIKIYSSVFLFQLDLKNSGRATNERPVDLIHKSQLVRLPESKPLKVEGKTSGSDNQGSIFFLPDLNMPPSEAEALYGTS